MDPNGSPLCRLSTPLRRVHGRIPKTGRTSPILYRQPAWTTPPGSLSAYLHDTLVLSADDLVPVHEATLPEGRSQEGFPEPGTTEPVEAEDVYEVLDATQERPRRPGQECDTSGKKVISVI